MKPHRIRQFTFCIVQDPLTLSLSLWGERTPALALERATNSVTSTLGEKDRIRGDFGAYHPDLI
jgi:hypothetical protein